MKLKAALWPRLVGASAILALACGEPTPIEEVGVLSSELTSADVANQLQQAMNAYLASHDVMTAAGYGGGTLSWAYSAPTNAEKVSRSSQVLCGPIPGPWDPEAMARWRSCSAITSYMLMLYHRWRADNEALFAEHVYNIAFQMDSLSATDIYLPAHGLPGPEYRLCQTNQVQGYLNDFGMGVLSGPGWLKAYVPVWFYAAGEVGGQGRWIDLHARIATVGASVIRCTDGFRSFRSDAPYLARSSAGRAVAAVLTGDATQRFTRLLEANDYVTREFGTEEAVGSPVPFSRFGVADLFQHLGVLEGANGGVASIELKSRAQIWKNIYFGSYFPQTGAIADLALNTYVKERVLANYPTEIAEITTCPRQDSQPLKAFTALPRWVTGGGIWRQVVVGVRGESVGDAIITSAPPLYRALVSAGDAAGAAQVLDTLSQAVAGHMAHPPLWTDEACVRPMGFCGETTQVMSYLREFAYLYFGRQVLLGATYQSFGYRPPLPPASQGQCDYVRAGTLRQGIWRSDIGYTRTVPILNGAPNIQRASAWSAPMAVDTLGVPTPGSLTSCGGIVTSTSLVQGVWKGTIGYTRNVPYLNGVEDWSCASKGTCPWSAPLSAGAFLGTGPMRAQSAFPVGNVLINGYWRDNGGYSQNVPLLPNGDPDWSCSSQGRCPWSGPFSPDSTGVPGTGGIQSQTAYVTGSTLYQEVWRDNQGYYHNVPVVGGVPYWGCASAGTCPWNAIAVPGFP